MGILSFPDGLFLDISTSKYWAVDVRTDASIVSWGATSASVPAGSFASASAGWNLGVALTTCYSNCDQSTAAPALTANDFQCFLNRFAESDPRANCDGSTLAPVLTANDFQCFLNRYASGCS